MDNLIKKILAFRDARNWSQYHKPKDLAISVALEAGELLENFQWRTNEEAVTEKFDNIKDELADVFIYLFLLSDRLGIDVKAAIEDKLVQNELKYPLRKAYGSRKKYDEL
ncbi:dCTP diphosphatase [Acididesulfobacillus acetoxydans]|uniref:Predicted pyrophosphatase n=1 Tax=Acididesulfobacillus acetoxydans TaxID=1561005 RepID=A0A8S0XCG6_9FIRM|nr:nucleotide pyrophosphohydrolase [Acididesulfobacillus acetoxydans]CAA7602426.1 dCTP diphosphatase [Acididesulfobacillus acetoxydans]CEJ08339.1 Predicted pyrophosphatase [Acididesulfobacillus acetoxydans]